MSIEIICSGLVGSIIGVIITITLYWHSRYIVTRRALVDRLIILRHDVFWDCSDGDVFKQWNSTLKEIWLLYNAFMDFVPPLQRKRICKAWKEYKGEDTDTINELYSQEIIVDNKKPPKSKKDFLRHVNFFIKTLDKKN